MSKKTPIDLAFEVDAFLERTGMSASAFGIGAIGQKPLVWRLREGRDVTTRTAAKIRKFMRDSESTSDTRAA